MQIINLPRGSGKTTRAVVLSELYGYPVLAISRSQIEVIKDRARELSAKIPEPILIADLPKCQAGVIVDEGLITLSALIRDKAGFPINIQAVTLTAPQINIVDEINNILLDIDNVKADVMSLPNLSVGNFCLECESIIRKLQNMRDKLALAYEN